MTFQTQYALLLTVPTSTIVLAACIRYWSDRRFLRLMNANFDRLEQTIDSTLGDQTKSR